MFRNATRQFQKGAAPFAGSMHKRAGEDPKPFSMRHLIVPPLLGTPVAPGMAIAKTDRADPVSLRKEFDHGIVDVEAEGGIGAMARLLEL